MKVVRRATRGDGWRAWPEVRAGSYLAKRAVVRPLDRHPRIDSDGGVAVEESTMAEESSKGRRSWLSVCVALLAFLVLYALSSGPAALIVVKTDTGREVAEVVYAPLILLRFTPLGKPMDAYMNYWARGLG